MRKIRGQVSIIPHISKLKTILCNYGYITPNKQDSYLIGATFKTNDLDTSIKLEEHQENINNFSYIASQITDNIDIKNISGKVNLRTNSIDYLPIVGPIANYEQFKIIYKDLKKDANYWINRECPYLKGLFVNIAHGSKGMLTAPICGEIIADYISNTPLPISENLRQALHPNRFWYKDIIRNKE